MEEWLDRQIDMKVEIAHWGGDETLMKDLAWLRLASCALLGLKVPRMHIFHSEHNQATFISDILWYKCQNQS